MQFLDWQPQHFPRMKIRSLVIFQKTAALLALLFLSFNSYSQIDVMFVKSDTNFINSKLVQDYNGLYTSYGLGHDPAASANSIIKHQWDSSFSSCTTTALSMNQQVGRTVSNIVDFRDLDSLVALSFISSDPNDYIAQNGFIYKRWFVSLYKEGAANNLVKFADLTLDSFYVYLPQEVVRLQGNIIDNNLVLLIDGAKPNTIGGQPQSYTISYNLQSQLTSVILTDRIPGFQEQFSYQGTGQIKRHIAEAPILGHYLADVEFYNSNRTMSTSNIGLFNASFDTILKMWPINNGIALHSRILVKDSNVVVFSNGGRYQNNTFYEDFYVGKFNFFNDSTVESYLIELIDSNNHHLDYAFPGCIWLENDYLVFTGVSDSNDRSQGQKNKLSIFSMNSQFKVANAAFVDNIPTEPTLPLIWPTSVIPYPLSTDTVVYSGLATNPKQFKSNIFWGKFGYKDNSIGIEPPLIKVNPQYLQLFPNPAPNGNVTIFNQDPQKRPFTIKVLNINGEKVRSFENLKGQKNHIKLGLAAGVYQLQFTQGMHHEQHRLVVQ
ncbi:MAG: hypothetical protein DA405_08345 [Bacteroidetes bacterium]|nr:MAG: hypothetical protein DA405_08345 [Bacteroidota bacterium]